MSALPPLNALRAFEASARRGSFAAAAQELNVTPAAIGQQVRQLEALIGAPLFTRQGRGLSLTGRGVAGLDRLSRAFELVGEASAAMREPGEARALILSAPSDLASAWLAPQLAGLSAAGERITLLNAAPETGLETSFEAGAEICLVFADAPPGGFEAQRLNGEILAPLAHPDLARSVTSIDDLAGHRLIEDIRAGTGWRGWLAARGGYGLRASPVLESEDGLTALTLAEAGGGIVLGRKSLAARMLAQGRLAPVFHDGDMAIEAGYYAVTRRGRRLSGAARSFLDRLRTMAARSFDFADEL